MPRKSIGPAAYHARLEVERIEKLEARVKELEAMLNDWISPFQLTAKLKQAVAATYAEAHRDGYRAGWSDKACGVAPHLYSVPEIERSAADR